MCATVSTYEFLALKLARGYIGHRHDAGHHRAEERQHELVRLGDHERQTVAFAQARASSNAPRRRASRSSSRHEEALAAFEPAKAKAAIRVAGSAAKASTSVLGRLRGAGTAIGSGPTRVARPSSMLGPIVGSDVMRGPPPALGAAAPKELRKQDDDRDKQRRTKSSAINGSTRAAGATSSPPA